MGQITSTPAVAGLEASTGSHRTLLYSPGPGIAALYVSVAYLERVIETPNPEELEPRSPCPV